MQPVVQRMLVLFLAVFIPTSIGDVWSTELGRQRPNTVELNPWGFQPLGQSIQMELVVCAAGCLLVALGAWLSADLLKSASTLTFWPFLRQFATSYAALVLVFAPITIAAMRVLAIINNVSILLMDWSPLGHYVVDNIARWTGLSDAQSLAVMISLAGGICSVPILWVIYAAARGRTSPAA